MQTPEGKEQTTEHAHELDMYRAVLIPKELLSLENTRMSSERTLMAWIRTSLSMISFGFTVFKFIDVLEQQKLSPILQDHTARNFGLILIGLGTFTLSVAIFQHYKYLKYLGLRLHGIFWDLSFLVGCLIGLLGLMMFISILINAGPFS